MCVFVIIGVLYEDDQPSDVFICFVSKYWQHVWALIGFWIQLLVQLHKAEPSLRTPVGLLCKCVNAAHLAKTLIQRQTSVLILFLGVGASRASWL